MSAERYIPAIAADLYRDRLDLSYTIGRLGDAGYYDLAIVAPHRGGKLDGSLFMGLPVIEGSVTKCAVLVTE